MAVTRLDGWEKRFIAVVDGARSRPYELGRHDCFHFACQVIEALTGIDHWSAWQSTYRTRAQALRRITEYGGNFTDAFSKLFGVEPCSVELARPGDICEFIEAAGEGKLHDEPHLAVVTGKQVALLAERGLVYFSVKHCHHCWRIG